MGGVDVGPSDLGLAAVGGEDDDGGDGGLEGAVEVSEALNVQHVHLCRTSCTRIRIHLEYVAWV